MRRPILVSAGLLALYASSAHALTCAQQAQACAHRAKEKGKDETARKCLAPARIAECQKTCVYTGADGRTWPAGGDCGSQARKR